MKALQFLALQFLCAAALIATFSGCSGSNPSGGLPTTGDFAIPEQCEVREGVEVVELGFSGVDSGRIELDEGETRRIAVTARLANPAPTPGLTTLCFVVRDVQAPVAPVIAAGFTPVLAGETEPNRPFEAFAVTCEDGEVVGESISLHSDDADDIDDSTNERRTNIYIQYTGDLQTFLGSDVVTGIDGVKSERIRVVCNR